jgi:hypothetical protein
MLKCEWFSTTRLVGGYAGNVTHNLNLPPEAFIRLTYPLKGDVHELQTSRTIA